MTINIENIQILVRERKNARTVRLTVKRDGTVVLSFPKNYSLDRAKQFVLRKKQWIDKCLAANAKKHPSAIKNGATLSVLDKPLTIIHVASKRKSVVMSDDTLTVYSSESTFVATAEKYVAELLRDYIQRRARYYSDLTGLSPLGNIAVRKMRSRWGQCNTATHDLTFALSLAFKPLNYVDCVVLHELAHFRHSRHDAAFYRLVTSYMPDYRQRKRALDKY